MWSGTHLVTYTHRHGYQNSEQEVLPSQEVREEERGRESCDGLNADLRVLAFHSVPAALGQAVLAVVGQGVLIVAVVRLPQAGLEQRPR